MSDITNSNYIIDLEAEKKRIKSKYRTLLQSWRPKEATRDRDRKLIVKAFKVSVEAHQGMRRKSGEPYIFHPLEVALICVNEIGLGTKSIVSALLHDVVEDTDYTLEDIRALFGDKIAQIIDGLTKIREILGNQPVESMQAENFKRLLLTMSDDVRVILIKLADRLHNMRTLDSMPTEKQLKIASETTFLYAPLAHRLGLHAIKSELEDLALRYTDPNAFQSVLTNLRNSKNERAKFIRSFVKPIKTELDRQGIVYHITDREKSISSIWNKMKNKGVPFQEVFDVFAVRIIVETPLETEKSVCLNVYSIVTDNYLPNRQRFRDWISTPKANGYESLHTTVMSKSGQWVEVQIRTKRMDEIAEKGYAAHWKYKSDVKKVESGLDEWLEKVREVLHGSEIDALDFMSEFKLNLFSKEIMVFTPKGDVKTLPLGATTLDFAYNIHSEVGNHCIAAKVNHKVVPLDYVLKQGDQVQILTSETRRPNEEWFTYLKTARAKSSLKTALKELKKQDVDQGKLQLALIFGNLKVENNKENRLKLFTYLNCKSKVDFYYKLAKGEIEEQIIRDCFEITGVFNWKKYVPFWRPKSDANKNLKSIIQDELRKNPDNLLLDKSIKDLKFKVAQCCNPIPGDDVIGINLPGKPIEIHRTNCETAISLMSTFGNQIIKAKWNEGEKVGFLAGIKITANDSFGLISSIVAVITKEYNINIRTFHIRSSGGTADGTVTLYVSDNNILKKLIKNINAVDGVISVIRIDEIKEYH
ncbi:MAG: bifunctional (p)ppGpp synthetase/guanosine-3',5'-bis(diphosphate) 3'-pyrophosphohydrolase [Bacteroidales bacterium]|nr:bifunctional (p)ppGpp synthetase/guanosine-3',5'-bis(diphosphate) 3'-pyrophosphohydrolase [Bacteroidales bacterium]